MTSSATNHEILDDNNDQENNVQPDDNKTKKICSAIDDDTNIHVPNNSSLQIEFVQVKKAILKKSDNIAYYDIQVSTAKNLWHVTKRYSEFEALHNQLLLSSKVKLPLLPTKHYKMFTDHTKKRFIEKRRALFDNYCRKLIQTPTFKSSQTVVHFFSDGKTDIEDILIMHNHEKELEEDDNNNNKNINNSNTSSSVSSSDTKQLLSDFEFPAEQEVTHIEIQSTRKMSDHVLYQITVSNSHLRHSFRCWTVLKRFTQFHEMDVQLRLNLSLTSPHILAQLPPNPHRKFKFVHDHMNDHFIEERRVIMENYLEKLLRFPEVANDEKFLIFLGVE